MMKKTLLLAFMLSVTASAFAVEAEIGGLWYELVSKAKEAKVIQYKNNIKYNGSIVIPATVEYNGDIYSVISIEESAFRECFDLTSVTIPNSVTSIGSSAFLGCSGLTSVTIPNSVTSIGVSAFYGCSGLTSVTIPNSVTSLGDHAFYGCSGLTSVTIPNSVTSIGYGAFSSCSGLTSVTIPNSVTSLGDHAFSGCSRLTSVTIPNSLTSIGSSAFRGCSGLTSVTIPNSVTSIGSSAFYNCSSLTSVTIGSGVKNIGSQAFAKCTELADVYCLAENVPSTQSNAFEDSYIEYSTLHVPAESVSAYKEKAPWSSFRRIVDKDMLEYTLTYLVDGEVYKTYKNEEGATIIPEAEPTKEGYTFSGWSEIPETMPAHDVTVTGTFNINKYKLTYTVDGEEYKRYEVEYGAAITAEPTPTKEGYTFSGWSEIPETMPAHDVTVTGTFSINSYKLTYMIDDKVYKEMMYEYGATITPEPQPEGDYQTFEWIDLPQTMPAHDVTVYATYTSGIAEIVMMQGVLRIYGPDGKSRTELQKGLNIVRMSDGTTKKIVVK